MRLSQIISCLDSHLKSEQKKNQALYKLLTKGRISKNTFDQIEKRINNTTTIALKLKDTLTTEQNLWNKKKPEKTKIFESLLIQLEHKRLLSEIGEEECILKSKIINQGLNTLRNNMKLKIEIHQKPTLPVQTTLEKPLTEEVRESLPTQESFSEKLSSPTIKSNLNQKIIHIKKKPLMIKEPSKLELATSSSACCMNPWKPKCGNTDINLSIYYNGHMTPICHQCWEEIANRNFEWSSL